VKGSKFTRPLPHIGAAKLIFDVGKVAFNHKYSINESFDYKNKGFVFINEGCVYKNKVSVYSLSTVQKKFRYSSKEVAL